jgi:aldehyde:ferredoxin oxidoreductase
MTSSSQVMSYAGPRDVLEVDLSTRVTRRYTLDDSVFAETLGGVGLAVWLMERCVEHHDRIDPLGPKNPLIFAAGPFASTPVPAANKHALATISPLTGLLNEGLSSSHWSAVLRRCGLAALVIEGIAPEWSVLSVDDSDVRIEPADDVLGLSPRETTKRLRERYRDRTLRVCAIGLAGERGVRFASIENDGRQAGRGGSGAVMGAKRLKAIALRGHGDVRVAAPGRVAEISAGLRERATGPATAKYRVLGTGANLRVLQRMGQLPTRNFRNASFEGAERITPEAARESRSSFVELRAGCAGCPVQCEHMYVRRGRDRRAAAASEYESVWAFGPNCGVDDLDAVLDAIALCDEYGIDTISTGATIAFAMEATERGLIPQDALATPLFFGNAAVLRVAIEAIVHGDGVGKLLRDGVRAAAERLGPPAGAFAMHAKGLELPGYEPRTLPTYALSLAVCTRGACHNRASSYDLDLRRPDAVFSDLERARTAIDAEDDAIIWDSLVLCKFVRGCFVDFLQEGAELWSAVSGLELGAPELRAVARSTWARKRRINTHLGWTAADDKLPDRLFEPVGQGPHAGRCLDEAGLLRLQQVYEAERGIDPRHAAGQAVIREG